MTGAFLVLLALHFVWLYLLAVGQLRWAVKDSRPKCKDCPIAKYVGKQQSARELHELPVLSID